MTGWQLRKWNIKRMNCCKSCQFSLYHKFCDKILLYILISDISIFISESGLFLNDWKFQLKRCFTQYTHFITYREVNLKFHIKNLGYSRVSSTMKNVFQNCSLVTLIILSASCFSLLSWLIKKVPFWYRERNENFIFGSFVNHKGLYHFQEVNSSISS